MEPPYLSGNVLTPRALERIRALETRLLELTGDSLMYTQSVVPCFFESASSATSEHTIQACLSRIVGFSEDDKAKHRHFATDLSTTFVAGRPTSCTALRTTFGIESTTDVTRWLHEVSQLYDGEIEVSWYGGSWLFWIEFYQNVLHDIYLLAAACAALLIILSSTLGMPLFALLSLSIVVVSFPVSFAAYCVAFGEEKLPLLAVVSLYVRMPGLEPWACTAHSAAHKSCFRTPVWTAGK